MTSLNINPTERSAATRGTRIRSGTADALSGIGRWRILELILFAALIFEGTLFGLPLPFNQVVMSGIILLAMTRRPQVDLGKLQLIVPVLVVALFYISMISMFSDPSEFAFDWKRRLVRLVLTAVLVLVIASGRVDFRSAVVGLGVGMVLNAVAFYAGAAPDGYGGVLSGFFIDKNVAGLAYAVLGLLLLSVAEKRWVRVLVVVGFAGLVWQTGSRTSMSAFASGVAWILLAPRLPVVGRWVLGSAIYLGVDVLAEDFSQVGRFSNREGSDLLRSRIDAASELKVADTGFFGAGLGEAYVQFEDEAGIWLFHNSYWSALVEGGWPWLITLVGITIVFGMRPFKAVLGTREAAIQGAVVGLLICSWRLGEVFFTLQWGLVIGAALWIWATPGCNGQSGEQPLGTEDQS